VERAWGGAGNEKGNAVGKQKQRYTYSHTYTNMQITWHMRPVTRKRAVYMCKSRGSEHIHIHIHIRIHTHTHTYIQMYLHTCTHIYRYIQITHRRQESESFRSAGQAPTQT
jgi:hypothetical protein